ncbi:MAG: hypothetical protein OEZ37_11860, partial [Gemmatimonadota bacterium]|nr:hypothetical protein [Gemmatimonadota bacterium]
NTAPYQRPPIPFPSRYRGIVTLKVTAFMGEKVAPGRSSGEPSDVPRNDEARPGGRAGAGSIHSGSSDGQKMSKPRWVWIV